MEQKIVPPKHAALSIFNESEKMDFKKTLSKIELLMFQKYFFITILLMLFLSLLFIFYKHTSLKPGHILIRKKYLSDTKSSWTEDDCYNYFKLNNSKLNFINFGTNAVYGLSAKYTLLRNPTYFDGYYTEELFVVVYKDNKFLLCHQTIVVEFLNTSFNLFRKTKKKFYNNVPCKNMLATMLCNNGNVSIVMCNSTEDDGLLIKGYYYLFPNEIVPGGYTVREWFKTDRPHEKIFVRKILTNLNPYAYFNLTIMSFIDHYCNPDFPIIYEIKGSK